MKLIISIIYLVLNKNTPYLGSKPGFAHDYLEQCIEYLEISVYIEQFEVDEDLFENALKKFLILPPIFLTDLQTLIVVLKLLHFALTKRLLLNKFNWVAEILTKSESMHHNLADDFKKDDKSKQLYNQFCIELYEVYWLCLKNYSHFSTLNLTKILFDRLTTTKKEIVLLQINMKCLTLLTENPKNIDKDLVKIYLSQFISLKTILMNNINEKSLQRSYLIVLNHILHYTILVPNISEVWCLYDWETWTWSMIHSTDLLVRALVFQFSAGLAVIDIPVSHNLIHLALNYFCESTCLENCVVAEQAALFCSNLFCLPKFKSLCHQCIIKLDFNAFVQIINLCSYYDYTKPEKKSFVTSPKLVSNICCMFFNMFTLTEVNLYELDQHNQFVQALFMCLNKYLTPMSIEKPNIIEMCGRICSVLTLFIPVSNYNFEDLLNSLNIIYERININLDYCTIMVWRSLFRLTKIVLQCTNYKTFVITNNLITALLTSVTSENKDLCIEALNVVSLVCPQLSEKFAHRVCNTLIHTLLLEWHHKLKRKMLLIALSNIFIEHPITYKTAKHDNVLHFIITKLKTMQLQVTKQSNQKSKILQNEYLEIVKFCCNLFYGCNDAREDASSELPDLIHKLWPIVVANPKSDILMCTLRMFVSLTSACPSACSAMTMTSSTLGMEPKTKCTSFSLFHEIITLSTNFHLNEDILNIMLLLVLNCCQAQECRVTITKSKLLSSIVLALNLKDKKCPIKIEQQYLKFLLVFTSYNEGQIHLLKVENVLDTLVDLFKSNYINDSLAILRNLCFNGQNRTVILSSDVFLDGIKTLLEIGNPTDQNYKDISLAIWSIACNNQKARLQLCHWGKMRAVLSKQYAIPRPAIETFLSICTTCNNKKGVNRKLVIKPIMSKDFNERGQIDLVDFQSLPDGKYKWILNYQDHHTKFISLLPLESKRAVEVASNLLIIFLTFGAPKILQSDNGRKFVNSIINEIKELWPKCIIVHGRPRHPQSQGSIKRSNRDVENMLRAWMKDNKNKKSSIGLKFVQFQKNSSHHRIIGHSPYKALFGCDPKIGLSTSNLPLEVIKKLTAEEDLEEIYSQYEEENLEQDILVKYCNMCKNESTEDACDLCKTNKTIHEERKAGHAGQEKLPKMFTGT
ncbi:hypothetical protein QTP88_004003 [Uroleucon formosanum]